MIPPAPEINLTDRHLAIALAIILVWIIAMLVLKWCFGWPL